MLARNGKPSSAVNKRIMDGFVTKPFILFSFVHIWLCSRTFWTQQTEGDGETGGVQVTTTVVTNSNSSGGFELSARGDYGEPVFPPRRSTNKTLSVDYFKRSPPPVIGTAAASKNMNAIVINKREREHDPDDGLSIRSLGDDDDYGEDLGSFEKASELESQPRRPRFQHQHQHQLDGRNLSFLSAVPPVAIPARPPRTRDRQRDIGWRNMIWLSLSLVIIMSSFLSFWREKKKTKGFCYYSYRDQCSSSGLSRSFVAIARWGWGPFDIIIIIWNCVYICLNVYLFVCLFAISFFW